MNNLYKKLMLVSLVSINSIAIMAGKVELNIHDKAFKVLKKQFYKSYPEDYEIDAEKLGLLAMQCQDRKTSDCDKILSAIESIHINKSISPDVHIKDKRNKVLVAAGLTTWTACVFTMPIPWFFVPMAAMTSVAVYSTIGNNYISPEIAQQLKNLSENIKNAPGA